MDKPPTADRQRVKRYVTKLLPKLGLNGWRVFVKDEWSDDEDLYAEVTPEPNVRESGLILGERWQRMTNRERGETLVHELLHLANADLRQYVHKVIIPTLPEDAREPLLQGFEDYNEASIDRLAMALYPLLPKYGD